MVLSFDSHALTPWLCNLLVVELVFSRLSLQNVSKAGLAFDPKQVSSIPKELEKKKAAEELLDPDEMLRILNGVLMTTSNTPFCKRKLALCAVSDANVQLAPPSSVSSLSFCKTWMNCFQLHDVKCVTLSQSQPSARNLHIESCSQQAWAHEAILDASVLGCLTRKSAVHPLGSRQMFFPTTIVTASSKVRSEYDKHSAAHAANVAVTGFRFASVSSVPSLSICKSAMGVVQLQNFKPATLSKSQPAAQVLHIESCSQQAWAHEAIHNACSLGWLSLRSAFTFAPRLLFSPDSIDIGPSKLRFENDKHYAVHISNVALFGFFCVPASSLSSPPFLETWTNAFRLHVKRVTLSPSQPSAGILHIEPCSQQAWAHEAILDASVLGCLTRKSAVHPLPLLQMFFPPSIATASSKVRSEYDKHYAVHISNLALFGFFCVPASSVSSPPFCKTWTNAFQLHVKCATLQPAARNLRIESCSQQAWAHEAVLDASVLGCLTQKSPVYPLASRQMFFPASIATAPSKLCFENDKHYAVHISNLALFGFFCVPASSVSSPPFCKTWTNAFQLHVKRATLQPAARNLHIESCLQQAWAHEAVLDASVLGCLTQRSPVYPLASRQMFFPASITVASSKVWSEYDTHSAAHISNVALFGLFCVPASSLSSPPFLETWTNAFRLHVKRVTLSPSQPSAGILHIEPCSEQAWAHEAIHNACSLGWLSLRSAFTFAPRLMFSPDSIDIAPSKLRFENDKHYAVHISNLALFGFFCVPASSLSSPPFLETWTNAFRLHVKRVTLSPSRPSAGILHIEPCSQQAWAHEAILDASVLGCLTRKSAVHPLPLLQMFFPASIATASSKVRSEYDKHSAAHAANVAVTGFRFASVSSVPSLPFCKSAMGVVQLQNFKPATLSQSQPAARILRIESCSQQAWAHEAILDACSLGWLSLRSAFTFAPRLMFSLESITIAASKLRFEHDQQRSVPIANVVLPAFCFVLVLSVFSLSFSNAFQFRKFQFATLSKCQRQGHVLRGRVLRSELHPRQTSVDVNVGMFVRCYDQHLAVPIANPALPGLSVASLRFCPASTALASSKLGCEYEKARAVHSANLAFPFASNMLRFLSKDQRVFRCQSPVAMSRQFVPGVFEFHSRARFSQSKWLRRRRCKARRLHL